MARRIGRWALFVVVGIVALVVLLRIGVGIYLHTTAGKELVASKLQAMVGMPVEVSSVAVGMGNSSVQLRILDPHVSPNDPNAAVVTVEDASADVGFWKVVSGQAEPRRITLKGVSLALHFDSTGKLLTALPEQTGQSEPGQLPSISVENSS